MELSPCARPEGEHGLRRGSYRGTPGSTTKRTESRLAGRAPDPLDRTDASSPLVRFRAPRKPRRLTKEREPIMRLGRPGDAGMAWTGVVPR